MSKIHPASETALLPQLDLWSIPGSQFSILRDVEYELRPVSTYSSSTPLRFEVRSADNEFMLFNESHLWMKLKITLSHPGKKIEGSDWAKVTPVSNLMHSLFKHVSVIMNNREVTVNPSNYSYKAYIENYLGFSDSAKKGRLSAIGWDEDPAARRKFITDGVQDDPSNAIIDFEGMLNLDFSFQEKTVPGNVHVILELIPNLVSFYMKTEGDYSVSVDFQDAVWYVHKALVNKETMDGIIDGFNTNPALFAFQFAPDLSNGGSFSSHVNLKKKGHLRVQLKFSERLNESLVAIAYCEYDSCIELNKYGEIGIDVNDVGY